MDAPVPTERETQITLVDAIHKGGLNPQWKFTHVPHGEYRHIATALRLQKMGTMKGFPDFVFIGPRMMLFIELKREGGRLSPEQEAWMHHIIHCGFTYHVAYSLDDALGTLFDYGVIKKIVVQ
jgi:hypothetical protein